MAARPRFAGRKARRYAELNGLRPDEAAGLRRLYESQGGALVGVYNGSEAGMDVDGGRWQTVCELHAHVISHDTFALAVEHAPHVEQWCESCMENVRPADALLGDATRGTLS